MDLSRKLNFLPIQNCSFEANDSSTLSPMTELANNFELSSMSTPRRKLALSNSMNPTPERSPSVTESLESGIEAGSPLFLDACPEIDSPTLESIRARKLSGGPSHNHSLRRQLMTRRSFSSPVLPRKPLEPLNFDDLANIQNNSPARPSKNLLKPIIFNSGCENVEENHSDLSLCEMSDQFPELNDDFEIKRRKYVGRSHSAPTVQRDLDIFDSGSSGHSNGSNDDGFFDELTSDIADSAISFNAPANLMGLINEPLCSSKRKISDADKENQVPKSKPIFIKPVGMPTTRPRSCSLSVKRDSPATLSPSPMKRKKRPRHVYRSKSFYDTNPDDLYMSEKKFELPTPTRALQRSQSFDVKHSKNANVDISKLFDMDDKKLIGDKSKDYCLPTCQSKHPDLKGITPETLTDLLEGKYNDVIGEFHIIDSRYPYEFEGGHIKDALNIFEKQELVNRFLKNPPKSDNEKRTVLIFHCEFSSKRGPSMSRFLRNKDRDAHQDNYPELYYPELYLLEGGYKEFYSNQPEYCEPKEYREMLDPEYQQQLKLFSKRSKSWSEDKSSCRNRRRPILRY